MNIRSVKLYGKGVNKTRVEITLPSGYIQRGSLMKDFDFADRGLNDEVLVDNIDTPLLSLGLRWVDRTNGFLIFERRPAIKNVQYHCVSKHASSGKKSKMTSIAVPWQVYIVRFSPVSGVILSVATYWRTAQLRGFKSVLGHPMIPNIYSDGAVCLPAETYEKPARKTLADVMDNAYRAVWDGVFNTDIVASQEVHDKLNHLIACGAISSQDSRGVHLKLRTTEQQLFPTENKSIDDVLHQVWLSSPGWTILTDPKFADEPVIERRCATVESVIRALGCERKAHGEVGLDDLYRQILPRAVIK